MTQTALETGAPVAVAAAAVSPTSRQGGAHQLGEKFVKVAELFIDGVSVVVPGEHGQIASPANGQRKG